MMDNRGRTPAIVWVAVLAVLLGYEAWAILFGGYEYTLTYPVRELIDQQPWTGSVLAALLAWLGVHFIVERRRKGR
jgi:hypothetical protein